MLESDDVRAGFEDDEKSFAIGSTVLSAAMVGLMWMVVDTEIITLLIT